MDFNLNDAQISFRDRVRDLSREIIAPCASRWDEEGRFPLDEMKMLAREGLFGIIVPKEYGGLGLDHISYLLALEEIARYDLSTALTVASHTSLACGHLLLVGSESQRNRYLPLLAQGEIFGAWALSESGAGSDPAGLKTRATRVNDGWRIDGSKMFVTQGGVAGLTVVMARTSDDEKNFSSAFLVEAGNTGVLPGKPLKKTGCRASNTTGLRLNEVFLPPEALLGREGRGLSDALTLLDGGRIAIAALAVGLARGALEESLSRSRRREQFGRPISSFQAIQWMLADMATEIDAARLLAYRASHLVTSGERATAQVSMAKLFATEMAVRAAAAAVKIFGGYGYLQGVPVERYLRDARALETGEGTSEIQRLIIARELLKK